MADKRKKTFLWMLIGGGILIILAGLAGLVMNKQAPPVGTPTPASVGQVQRVSLEDAKTAFDAGSAVFLDVRDSRTYAASHIPGAVLIPITDLPNRRGELDPSSWIITYCT